MVKLSSGGEMGELKDRIRTRRLALGLTLSQVADRAELSLPYIANLERGRGNPTVGALRKIAAALELPASALLGDDAEGRPADPGEPALASMPRSLLEFSRSERFSDEVNRLAVEQHRPVEEVRRTILVGMASAPRRSQGEPTATDWQRLLDTYILILRG
jgi:transcriptional regulator with XRE-family HTH domain